jgi:hypothetical protein
MREASRSRGYSPADATEAARVVTVAMSRGAVAVVAAIVVGGCAGGEEQEQVFTPADATRIANVRPVMPGWTWPQNPEKPVSSGSQTEDQSTNPLLAELRRQTADIVSLREAGHKWRDSNKLANLVANVLASTAEAHKLMAPFNAFSRGWAESYGRITKDEEIDGLGDEAWLLRTETDGGTEVTYHWRRGNLVVEAHVDCFAFCPGDVDAAARAWVDAIDEAATAGS